MEEWADWGWEARGWGTRREATVSNRCASLLAFKTVYFLNSFWKISAQCFWVHWHWHTQWGRGWCWVSGRSCLETQMGHLMTRKWALAPPSLPLSWLAVCFCWVPWPQLWTLSGLCLLQTFPWVPIVLKVNFKPLRMAYKALHDLALHQPGPHGPLSLACHWIPSLLL